MTRLLAALRGLGLAAVVAAIVDPGCPRVTRPVLELTFAGVPEPAQTRIRSAVIAATREWADVGEPAAVDVSTGAVLRAVVGRAGDVRAELGNAPAALAIEPGDPGIDIAGVTMPVRVAAGTRALIGVALEGRGATTVTVFDRTTGREEARLEAADADGVRRVELPWLATGQGTRTLRVKTSAGSQADVVVDVVPSQVRVRVLEARPTWSARFARLAMAASPGIEVETQVRLAPGLQVATSPQTDRTAADSPAAVVVVGGVDALSASDVAALEVDVRERGRALVLLMDEPPGPGPWQRLWPDGLGRQRSAPELATMRVGTHVWRVREWLALPVSTMAHPLAYLDSERDPVVVGRSLGAGRVVLVGALDAWRWRAETDTAFALGWQALVSRLAADVPPPASILGWASGDGPDRALEVELTLRPDQARAAGSAPVVSVAAGEDTRALSLWPAGSGVWRGAMRGLDGSAHVVEARWPGEASVAPAVRAVIDVSANAPAAVWSDVERHQAAASAVAVREQGIGEAFRALGSSWRGTPGETWHVTRTWWYAAGVLVVLGSEWILRRAMRRR